jgi:uncharacterized membrane protein
MTKKSAKASRLLALVFDDPYDADEAKAALYRMGGEGLLDIDETAVVVRQPDGKVRVTQDVNVVSDRQHAGHVLGLVAAAVTGTMPLILAGTLGGRLLGRIGDHGITNKFTKDVGKELQPGTSALLLLAHADAEHPQPERRRKILERLRQWSPRVLESDLPPELEAELNAALQHESAGA